VAGLQTRAFLFFLPSVALGSLWHSDSSLGS
jgi:hypothetical protein